MSVPAAIPNPGSETSRRAVVVTFDHLHLGYLGCYGNDWIETPNLDRLATTAVVFDRHCCENIDPTAANHAWWNGIYQFALDAHRQRRCPSFLDELQAAQVDTHLIVESDGRDDTAVAPPFGRVSTVRGADGFDVAEGETPFARTVKRCAALLTESSGDSMPALLWIKSRGVPVPWVPPRQFADLYLEEFGLAARSDDDGSGADVDEPDGADRGDPEDPEESAAGAAAAPVDDSLDWRYAAAMYAAYVTLLDRWLGQLLAAIDESPGWKESLLIVCAGAGQSLGEHGALVDERIPLRAECLQTPLWVRVPGSDQAGTRRQALVQTVDLAPTLLEWFYRHAQGTPVQTSPEGAPTRGHSLLPVIYNTVNSHRDMALMGNGRSEWGIRTDEFFYVEPGDRPDETKRSAAVLFEKPHDRWDQFDVLSQFPQVSEDLRSRLRQQIEKLEKSVRPHEPE
ncbi:MAG TPA: sulfatase-like hydrolase/transferase [Planctomycetaceae bacterium]